MVKVYSLAAAALAATLLAGLILWASASDTFFSVEFGLAELSPRGEEGGYAMPASGASAPTGLSHSCSSDGRSVTLRWSSSSYQGLLPKKQPFAHLLGGLINRAIGISVVYAGGGGGDVGTGGFDAWGNNPGGSAGPYYSGSSHGHPVPAPVTYNVKLNGSTVASAISSNSHSVSINPDTNYNWSVQACAGGACSSEQSSSFSCPAPPSVTLTADQYTVPYNTGTTLRWNSNHTNTCSASGAWSGSKSVSGSEPTALLTEQTTYYLQCSGPRGTTAPAAATINIEYGTGADISVNCGAQTGNSVTVRKGQICPINWNTGTSAPANCTLRAGAVVLSSPLTTQTGTYDWEVFGETTVYLDCEGGNNLDSFDVRILPEFQET